MKRTLLFLTCFCFFTLFAMADPVDQKRALQIAKEFVPKSSAAKKVPGKSSATPTSNIVYTHKMPKSGRDAFYIVNVGDAFVLVSADDVAHQILGYSFDKGFPVAADGTVQLPPHVKGFFDDLAAQMEAAIEAEPNRAADDDWTGARKTARRSPSNLPDSVGPLLTTTWDQGQYYNALCPEDANGPDGHVWTGCVATAMAQIIKYWGEPVHGRGSHSYNLSNLDPASMGYDISNEGTISANYENATYDFNHMPKILTSESSPEEVSAVAQLMFHCGVSVNMEYGASSSGARNEDVRSALISYFGFTPTLGLANRQLYTDKEWEDSLRANIDRGEPVFYSGSNLFNAHAFVLDGYKQNGYFHFNFGWSGDCDGWYLTKAVNPGFGYNECQSAIMGIRPDSNSHAVICHKMMHVQNNDRFTVTEPIDLFPMRGGSLYKATNEMNGVGIHLELVPKDNTGQLVLDILDFDKEQSVAIYDGVNKDSLVRVIETRNLDNYSTVFFRNWLYDALPSDTIFQNMAGMDFSPIVSKRHGFTVVVYSYGGMPEGFQLRVRNSTDMSPNTPTDKDLIHWTDIVKSEPEGYLLDDDTIRISSAEGLAWLSHCIDSLWINGINYTLYAQLAISIEKDIDLGGYLWMPIRLWDGNVNGNGHVIKNMEVSTSGTGGLFSSLGNLEISDIGMINAKVNSVGTAGTLAGFISNCIVTNCYSTNHIISVGNSATGGLIGVASDESKINNCYAYGDISAQYGYGGLVGSIDNSEINNCVTYVGESFNWSTYRNSWFAMLTEEVHGGTFSNCFADISVAKRSWDSSIGPEYDALAKRAYFLGNVYNVDAIDNLAAFNSFNPTGTLLADTAVNYTLGGDMNVITALNNKVAEYNLPNLRTWVMDSETHRPVFSDYYEVTCPNVSNISAENISYNGDFAVALSWQENGKAIEWQVKYNIINAPEKDATVFTSNDTQTIIEGLQLGNEYEFYVRPLQNGVATIGWGQPVHLYVDKTLWIDMVTECPEGYSEDSKGNVTISSPEGLAWLAKIGCNYRQDTISIVNDLDMSAYKWTPIDCYSFEGTVEGNNHIISNIYCNEDFTDDNSTGTGLFAHANNASFNNIVLQNSSFSGTRYIGALVGYLENGTVVNCHAMNVSIKGIDEVGGLGGCFSLCETYNCSSSGIIYADLDEGGLIGTHNGTITNCYSSCIIAPLGYKDRMYYGGLFGTALGTVRNCYSSGNVEMDSHDPYYSIGSYYGGTSIGHLSNVIVTHTYAQSYGSLPFAARFEENVTLSDTSSVINNILQTSVTIGETSYIDLVAALNAWVDANNTEGQYRHWVADTENVNGGYPIFAPAYTLTYKVDGEVYKTSSLEVGAALSPIAEPTKDGYTFGGWSELPETMPNHDVEVTGTFYLYGDVNTDTKVNVVDVVDIARFVVDTPSDNFCEKLADLNSDLSVNIVDAVVLVNHIAGDQYLARTEISKNSIYNYESCDLKLRASEENCLSLTLTGDMDFTAFQFEVDMPEGIDISAMRINSQRKDGHQLLFNKVADNRYRVAALSMSNAVFKGNDGELLNISLEGTGLLDICIHDIHFVTTNGTDVVFDNVFLNGNTTGIADVHAKENTPIYDLQGRRHSTLQRGTNIVGNKKIVVK